MPTLEITNTQVFKLVNQLQRDQQESLYQYLVKILWPEWTTLSQYGEKRVREVAARYGKDWDGLSEEEKETFIDEIAHEDRK